MIINVKFQEDSKSVDATFAQNDGTVRANFGEFQKVPATANHGDLLERDAEDQHPISAISGLRSELDSKQPKGDYLTKETDPTVPAWAKQSKKPTYTAKEVGAIPEEDVQSIVDTALAQAKASGEFDGKDGYTPQKNVDYFDGKDGYTPVKNKDYFDGYTPRKGVDYFDGQNGADGKDGVSVTHQWSGTTLFVTSASGTSSANLKGDTGADGKNGADGYTPVKGKDYYTDADKAEMVQAVLAALPSAEGVGF